MSLSHYEQNRLSRIEASLCRSDPKLADMFGRLCVGQRMPAWEQAPSRLYQIRAAAALLAAAAAVAAARLLLAAGRDCAGRPCPAAAGRPAADRIWPGWADHQ